MPESVPAPPRAVIPDHELLWPIGRGSYGDVWLARSVLGELRAVKLVRHSGTSDSGPASREFDGLRKFEPISRSHPGLVHILHAGRFDGGFYYVMELADDAAEPPRAESSGELRVERTDAIPSGSQPSTPNPLNYSPRTLRSELQGHGHLPVAECVELALKLTDALAHLHGHGLVHRDLKPSNIIFAGGQPKLADIGLVASADASMSCVGTEGYLPPEGPGKPPADLYALGKVLYELATGRDRTDFPELPTLLREDTQREALEEFNEVILKACDPDLCRRYHTAAQMRADLLLMQSGRSLRGARTVRERLVFARRAGALVGVAALLAVAAYFYQQSQTREARRLAQAEAKQRTRAESLVGTLQLKQAERLFEKDEGNQGVAYLARMLRQNPSNQIAAARLMSALNDRSFALPLRVFEFPELINDLELSPDGTRFVTWTRGTNQVARLWDVATGRIVGKPMAHANSEVYPQFSPDGRWIATAVANSGVQLWDGHTGAPVGSALKHDEAAITFEFAPNGQTLLVAAGNKARVWQVPEGVPALPPLDAGSAWVSRARFSPDGSQIVTGSADPRLDLWDARTGRHLVSLDVSGFGGGRLSHLQFSPDGRLIAASLPTDAAVWEVESGRMLHRLRHDSLVWDANFSPDGLRFVTGDDQRWVRVWDTRTGQQLVHPIRHGMDLWTTRFDPAGERLLTRERKHSRLWDSRNGRPLTEWIGGWRAQFSPDGRHLLTHDHHQGVLFDVQPGRAFSWVRHHRSGVSSAQLNAAGNRVVVASGGNFLGRREGDVNDDEVRLWDTDSKDFTGWRIGIPGGLQSVEFSPNGSNVVTASVRGQVQIWDARTGGVAALSMQHDRGVVRARYNPDGQKLVTRTWTGAVQIWDAKTGVLLGGPLTVSGNGWVTQFSPDSRRVLILSDPDSRITKAGRILNLGSLEWMELAGGTHLNDAHFSPDGARVVGAQVEPTVATVWDAVTGAKVGEPLRHQAGVWSARYSPDGRRIVTASTDQTARIWDAETFQPIGDPMRHEGLVAWAAFSQDSRRVVTVSPPDHAVRVWDAETGHPLTELLRHEDWATAGEFSPDGRRVLTASMDGTVHLWDLPPAEVPVPGWVLDLAEAVAGHRLLEHEAPEPVSAREFLALKDRILASAATDHYTTWARWFLSDRSARGVSFTSRVTAKEHLNRLVEWGSVTTLREAIQFTPNHAEAPARLARQILTDNPSIYPRAEQAAAFLADRAARLAPDALQTWWAKAEVQARTNHFAGALEALEQALDHAPASPELWRLKAQWLEQSGQLDAALPAYTRAIALLDPQGGSSAPTEPGSLRRSGEPSLAVQENSLHPVGAAL
jgi:WD40 repeat protein